MINGILAMLVGGAITRQMMRGNYEPLYALIQAGMFALLLGWYGYSYKKKTNGSAAFGTSMGIWFILVMGTFFGWKVAIGTMVFFLGVISYYSQFRQGVKIGVNKESVVNEWGNPDKSIQEGNKLEWHYKNGKAVYFTNDIVDKIQNTKMIKK